ncbi:MAG: O-antigen ligase family protein [Lachnospiraceae bacterium]|nr:O-antigen ligase family protein [Lachnospiraceae bacterium]
MKNKLEIASEYIVLGLFLWFMLSSFISQDFYAVSTRYGTAVFAVGLCLLFVLNRLQEYRQGVAQGTGASFLSAFIPFRDRDFVILLLADALALVNLFLLHSHKGAFLVVFDLTLLLYLSDKIRLSHRTRRLIGFSGCMLLIPWYSYVRWDYGFNMAGLVFLLFLIFGTIFLEYIKNDFEFYYLGAVQGLFFATTFLLAFCYQSRSSVLTILVFGLIWLLLPRMKGSKLWHGLLLASLTAGSILFTAFYIFLDFANVQFRFLNKNFLSGREQIWVELWKAFSNQILTGIGSSYEIKSFFIFEVHNGLFDILVVHGLVVFLLIFYLLIKRLWAFRTIRFEFYPDRRLALAGICALLFASFFENGFIVPPYSMAFFALFLLAGEE